jgi:hypothetical protein
MTFALFPLPIALLKLATVLFLILVFVPFISARQGESELPFNFAVEIPDSETWGHALANAARSYARSFWTVFRVAFPLMILAAVLGAFAVELLPQQALSGSVTVIGIIGVALVSAFLPVPTAFDVAIAYILMAKGVPLPYVAVNPVHSGDHQRLFAGSGGKDYLLENRSGDVQRCSPAGDCGRSGCARVGMR